MNKVAVVYWSGTGNTEAMAQAVAKGARDAGAEADLFTAAEFDAAMADRYEALAFGCPAMGSEELEDGEFEPMFSACRAHLGGRKLGLFGSYDWGDGEWMRTWQENCRAGGLSLVSDGVIANNAPDKEALAACEALGAALV